MSWVFFFFKYCIISQFHSYVTYFVCIYSHDFLFIFFIFGSPYICNIQFLYIILIDHFDLFFRYKYISLYCITSNILATYSFCCQHYNILYESTEAFGLKTLGWSHITYHSVKWHMTPYFRSTFGTLYKKHVQTSHSAASTTALAVNFIMNYMS